MLRTAIITFLVALTAARAAETPASEASIREMLQVTEARKLVDGMFPQVESMMKSSIQQAMKGRTISEADQKVIDRMTAKVIGTMKEELNWEKLEPLYLTIYQKSFSQEEVEGMLAFYKSPAGSALIKKLPVVMHETMASMQERMGPMMQRMQSAIKSTVEEITAEKANKE
jgi:uncharacterized protein